MKATPTKIHDCIVITPKVYKDDRGFFCETYNKDAFQSFFDTPPVFVQDNQSESHYGVVRGMHYQVDDAAQAKLVRVIRGKVLDVVVDLRKDSPTFLKHVSVELDHESMNQLFVPRGCAHGFVTLSKHSIFAYKCDNLYNSSKEHGIRYNDPELNIDWQLPQSDIKLSNKDLELPFLKDAVY